MYHNELQYEGLTNVWLTPRWLIDVIGPFDLDPCAADPRPFDIGTVNYTEADDGLAQTWEGFVFCNPPYGPHVGTWMDRMAIHGNGIGLVFARTETKAMQQALRACSSVFFFNKRVTFLRGKPPHDPGPTSGGAPSCLLAFGRLAEDRIARLEVAGHGLLFKRMEVWALDDLAGAAFRIRA